MENNELIHRLQRCDDIWSAPELLKAWKEKYEQAGYVCKDILMGAFTYALEDGIVYVGWKEFDGVGWIYEEATPFELVERGK